MIQAPYRHESDTSREAAETLSNHKAMVSASYAFIISRGEYGATGDELAIYLSELTGNPVQAGTASARMNDLLKAGKITKTAMRRKTRSGKTAAVLMDIEYANKVRNWCVENLTKVHEENGKSHDFTIILPSIMTPKQSGLDALKEKLQRNGHGHVIARIDGHREGCGGVNVCRVCRQENAYFEAMKEKEKQK